MPEANRQTCQIRRAQRRYFSHLRTFNAGTQNVGLELHQEVVGYRTAVHAQGVQTNAGVRLHRFQHVARLVGDGFQGRTNNVVRVHTARQAENRAAGVRIPVRCAQTGKRWHHVYAIGVFHFGREVFGVKRIADQLHLVAQPLNGGTRHEYRPFQGIVHFTAWAAGDGGQQTVF